MSILIVLFGQENEADGKLRIPAVARCAKAAEVFREMSPGSEVVILPTAAFGKNFNTSAHPHFYYLTNELIHLGVPPENILPGVVTSNTLQDATEAWYRFKNGGFHKLVAVTSDYHADRVAMILGRLSGNDDAEIEVVPAETPSGYQGTDRALEPAKIERLKREWVDVIPRNANVPPERVTAVYSDAGRELRHFENLAMVAAAALVIVNAIAFLIVPGQTLFATIVLLIFVALIDAVLWLVFWRIWSSALTARRVLTRMEFEHRMPGTSANRLLDAGGWFNSAPWSWSMRELVTALTAVLFLGLVAAALASSSGGGSYREYPTTRTGVVSNANSAVSPTPYSSNANGTAYDRFANRLMESNSNGTSNRRR